MAAEEIASDPTVEVELTGLDFHDGTYLPLAPGSITVIVGPNNSGKSKLLIDIHEICSFQHVNTVIPPGRTLSGVRVTKSGTFEQLVEWLRNRGLLRRTSAHLQDEIYYYFDRFGLRESQLRAEWERQENLGQLTFAFIATEEIVSRPQFLRSISQSDPGLNSDHPHPLQILAADSRKEATLSALVERAFGIGVHIHRLGDTIDLKFGQPRVDELDSSSSNEALAASEELEPVSAQGDGVRYFVGLLLKLCAYQFHTLLIDEPEAFLHPPLAKMMGRALIELTEPKGSSRSLGKVVVATHSQDVLLGILEKPTVRPAQIVRLNRPYGEAPRVKILDSDSLKDLLRDPFIYHSHILDGLFHDGVVVCEADSDCRYYQACLDEQFGELWLPDLMFVQVGGKSRMRRVVDTLRKLHIPTVCVPDFDIFNDQGTFENLVKDLGGTWADIRADFRTLSQSVQDPASPTVHSVQEKLNDLKRGMKPTERFDSQKLNQLAEALRATNGWKVLKRAGMSGVDRGAPWRAAERLLNYSAQIGIFPVPVGELESWHPRVDGKSGVWLAEVFEKNLHAVEARSERREFLNAIIEYFAESTGRGAGGPPEALVSR